MRKTLGTSILLLALSCSAYAGNIPNDSPAPATRLMETTNEPVKDQAAGPTVAEIALTLLQTVLTIL